MVIKFLATHGQMEPLLGFLKGGAEDWVSDAAFDRGKDLIKIARLNLAALSILRFCQAQPKPQFQVPAGLR